MENERRGGRPVCHLSDLDPVEAAAVLYLRLWCDGPGAQAGVWNDLAASLGPQRGRAALSSFERLCDLCTRHARRPLLRHNVHCACVGSDEACFANFIATAAEGEHEDAIMLACLMIRADVAPMAVGLAQQLGFAFRSMKLSAPESHPEPSPKSRLH